MVLFVYTVISPMTPLITGACFAFMGAMFRGQFMYIYGKRPDSGGKLFASFIQIMLSCMLIAEITSEFTLLPSAKIFARTLTALLRCFRSLWLAGS